MRPTHVFKEEWVAAFTSDENITRWLEGKPNHVAVVLAARAAIRVIPLLTTAFSLNRRAENDAQSDAVLKVFRCAAAAWAVAAYPGRAIDLRSAAAIAGSSIDDRIASKAEAAAAWASAAADAPADDVGRFSSHAVAYAVAAATDVSRQALDDILNSCAADADLLEQGFSAPTLALSSTLWPSDPDWAFDRWAHLESALLGAQEDWEVWTDWYEARLKAGGADQDIEVRRVTIPNKTWNLGPKVVNGQIRRWFEERGIWRHATPNERPTANGPTIAGEDSPPDPTDTLAFQDWLSTKPREWAIVIAARCALRAVGSLGANPGDASLLSILRATSASRYAALYPGRTKPAIDAAEFLRKRDTQSSIAAFYAASAVGAEDAVSRAVTIISDLGGRFDPTLTASVLRDAFDLRNGTPPQQLARAPLWRPDNEGGTPPRVRRAWLELASVLRGIRGHWEAWIEWYDYVLEGSPPASKRSDAWEMAFVDVPASLPWLAGPKAVNTEIATRLVVLQSTGDAAGLDLDPVEGVNSPIVILQRPDGRIGAEPGSLAAPDLPPPLTPEDHARSLSACRSRAGRLRVTASAQGFQARRDYADGISAYLEWLPAAPGTGNILLADGEARLLSKLFTADEGTLPTGFAAQLAVFLEDHIGLRVFYPELERHYLAVRTGRLTTPLQRDAVEGVQRAIRANTPIVFHESVSAVVDETAKPVPEVKPSRPENAPAFDPNLPRPPKDPIADVDPAKTRSFILASTVNRIWGLLLKGKDLPTAIEGWHKAYEQIKPHIGPVLGWLKLFWSGGDGGTPPMPPTIAT